MNIMIDEYGNEGIHRWEVTLRRGEEKKIITICANSIDAAEHRALKIADDEDFVIWNNPDSDLEVLDETEMLY